MIQPDPYARVTLNGWPGAIVACVLFLSLAGCIVGSLWAFVWLAAK